MKKILIGLIVGLILGFLSCYLLQSVAFAANDVTHVPIRIDTFGSDVTISNGLTKIKTILITAYSSAKTITFINDLGANVLVLECPAGQTISWPPPNQNDVEFSNGLIFDDSASDLDTNDFIFLWAK